MKYYFFIFCILSSQISYAQTTPQETNRNHAPGVTSATQQAVRLWQDYQQQTASQHAENNLNRPTAAANEITLDGHSFTVENNVAAVGQALYIALNQQLWQYAEKFLQQYRQFPDHRPELVWFAEGTLARINGDLTQAERYYRQLLQAQPDFLRGELDLARILFENKKNKEAQQLFRQLARKKLPAEVHATLQQYQQALAEREQWHGGITLGYQYRQNINQSAEDNSCLQYIDNICVINRRSPKAINAKGLGYELNLSRKLSLVGHHGLHFYFNADGQYYPQQHHYNETAVKSYFGYRFQNANKEIIIAPLFEYDVYDNKRYYHAWGGHFERTQLFSAQSALNIQFEQKRLLYSEHYTSTRSANISNLFTTWYYAFNPNTTVFIGLDGLYRSADNPTDSYTMLGGRIGINHQFNMGLNLTLLALNRQSRYRNYNAILQQTRKDKQEIYLAILKMPKWTIKGITPSILLKRTHNHSNVNWLYSYRQNEVQFNLEWQF